MIKLDKRHRGIRGTSKDRHIGYTHRGSITTGTDDGGTLRHIKQ